MREAFMPLPLVAALLREASSQQGNLILVGGQSLAYWMGRYGLSLAIQLPAVTRDVDFLALDAANRRSVERMAIALAGTAVFPAEHSLTALIGQAVREVPGQSEFLNVDILCKVFKIDKKEIAEWAINVEWQGSVIYAMHPLHVLTSRLHNLYQLPNKQNDLGEAQLRASIEVMRAFSREVCTTVADNATARGTMLLYARKIEHLARLDAGRKVALRRGIHVADAIEPEAMDDTNFWLHKVPRLLAHMSEEHQEVVLAKRAVMVHPSPGG